MLHAWGVGGRRFGALAVGLLVLVASSATFVSPAGAAPHTPPPPVLAPRSAANGAAQLGSPPVCLAPGPGNTVVAREANGVLAVVDADLNEVEFDGYGGPSPPLMLFSERCVATGPDGAIWYVAAATTPPEVVRLATNGTVLGHWPIAGAVAGAGLILAGPDGKMWFTAKNGIDNQLELGRITTTGTMTYPLLSAAAQVLPTFDLAVAGAHMWVGLASGQLGWLGDDLSFHPASAVYSTVNETITEGPDGLLWAGVSSRMVRNAESGVSDTVDLGACCDFKALVTGIDHALYFLNNYNVLGRLTTDGELLISQLPPGTSLRTITALPNGDVYVGSQTANTVTRLGISPWVHFVDNVFTDALKRPADSGAETYFTTTWLQDELSPAGLVSFVVSTDEYLQARVDAIYVNLLHRHADPGGKAYWATQLRNGWRDEQLESAITGSDEYFSTRAGSNLNALITVVYQDLLHRTPEPSGRDYWLGRLQSGTPRAAVAEGIVFSREAFANVVNDIYHQYLHRGPDPAGGSYWTDRLIAGTLDEQLVVLIVSSNEYFGFGLDP